LLSALLIEPVKSQAFLPAPFGTAVRTWSWVARRVFRRRFTKTSIVVRRSDQAMRYGDADRFGGSCDQQIAMAHGSVVQPALLGELFVDLERSLPLLGADRTVR
jgi:hypothetical protein